MWGNMCFIGKFTFVSFVYFVNVLWTVNFSICVYCHCEYKSDRRLHLLQRAAAVEKALLTPLTLPMTSSSQTATPQIHSVNVLMVSVFIVSVFIAFFVSVFSVFIESVFIANVKFKADCNSTVTSQPICHTDTLQLHSVWVYLVNTAQLKLRKCKRPTIKLIKSRSTTLCITVKNPVIKPSHSYDSILYRQR